MDEITEIRQLMDPPQGLRPHTTQAARRQLMLAAVTPASKPRRWVPPLAVGASAAAAAAVAMAATASVGHGQGPRPATLTAWTVQRVADGTVTVTLREFRDPSGLQRSLSAAGVPAVVQSSPSQCPYPYQAIPGNASIIGQVVVRDTRKPGSDAVFTIHPAAIPAGTKLDIVFPRAGADRTAKPAAGSSPGIAHPVAIRLIASSQSQCVKPSPLPSASQPQAPPDARPGPNPSN